MPEINAPKYMGAIGFHDLANFAKGIIFIFLFQLLKYLPGLFRKGDFGKQVHDIL